ncbi:unnamed protein product, partial [Brassica oleracea]
LFFTLSSHSHISLLSHLSQRLSHLSHLSQRLSRLTTTASPPRLTTTVFPLVSPPPRWRSQGSWRLEEPRFMAA